MSYLTKITYAMNDGSKYVFENESAQLLGKCLIAYEGWLHHVRKIRPSEGQVYTFVNPDGTEEKRQVGGMDLTATN